MTRKTALIVDDSGLARRHTRRLLEALGFAVVEAINGENAIAQFSTNLPDVVLLDLVMSGGMDGQETLEKLIAIDRTCRIFVVTADSHEMTKAAVLERGAVGVIVKPLTERALAGVMQSTAESAAHSAGTGAPGRG